MNNRFLLRTMGKSAVCNGTSSKIDVPYVSQLDITDRVTMGCFVKMSKRPGTGYEAFMCKGGSEAYSLDYDEANNRFRFVVNTTGSSYRQMAGSTDSAKLNTWALITGTYDSSTGSMVLYVNGVAVSSGTVTGGALVTNTNSLSIGYRSGGNDRYLKGQISQPFLYHAVLTQAQIQDIYYKGVFSTTNLVYLSYLSDNANDASGNGNNGTTANVTFSSEVMISPRTPS